MPGVTGDLTVDYFAAIDHAASEPELQQIVYAMVRMLKPEIVAETGTYKGGMTYWLGKALLDNGGETSCVHSCEPMWEFAEIARTRCKGLPVFIHNISSSTMVAVETADFLFLDSDYKYREEEIRRAKPGAVIVIHDAFKSYDPNIAPLAPLIEQMGGLCFRCGIEGRGFGILVKR